MVALAGGALESLRHVKNYATGSAPGAYVKVFVVCIFWHHATPTLPVYDRGTCTRTSPVTLQFQLNALRLHPITIAAITKTLRIIVLL
jgi:hypothetical protein